MFKNPHLSVLQQYICNGRFRNGCITKWCLHNSTNELYYDLVSRLIYNKKVKVIKIYIFVIF
jgi:hypothetical protein